MSGSTIDYVDVELHDGTAWVPYLCNATRVSITRGVKHDGPKTSPDVGTTTIALLDAGDPLVDPVVRPNTPLRVQTKTVPIIQEGFDSSLRDWDELIGDVRISNGKAVLRATEDEPAAALSRGAQLSAYGFVAELKFETFDGCQGQFFITPSMEEASQYIVIVYHSADGGSYINVEGEASGAIALPTQPGWYQVVVHEGSIGVAVSGDGQNWTSVLWVSGATQEETDISVPPRLGWIAMPVPGSGPNARLEADFLSVTSTIGPRNIFTGYLQDVNTTYDREGRAYPTIVATDAVQNIANTQRFGAVTDGGAGQERWHERINRLLTSTTVPSEPPAATSLNRLWGRGGPTRMRSFYPFGTLPSGLIDWFAGGVGAGWSTSDGPVSLNLSTVVEAPGTITQSAYSYGRQTSITGLVVGRTYRVSAKIGIWGTQIGQYPAMYALGVEGIGWGTAVRAGTWAYPTLASYTFTATATSHNIRVATAQVFSHDHEIAGMAFESAFATEWDLSEYVPPGGAYRLQDVVYESTLLNHFNMACYSIGAFWWIDGDGVLRFGDAVPEDPIVAHFGDVHLPSVPPAVQGGEAAERVNLWTADPSVEEASVGSVWFSGGGTISAARVTEGGKYGSGALQVAVTTPPAGTVFTENFSTITASTAPSWTVVWTYGAETGETARPFVNTGGVGAWGVTTISPRTGTSAVYLSTGTGNRSYTRSETGLTIGRRYRFSLWMRNYANSEYIAQSFAIGVQGFGSNSVDLPPYLAAVPYVQNTYEFVATATTHVLTLTVASTGTSAPLVDDMVLEWQSSAGSPANWNGWTAGTGVTFGVLSGGLRTTRTSGTGAVATKVATGLTVGTKYILTAQVREGTTNFVDSAWVGISGIGAGSTVNPAGTLTTASYTFIATATSHTIQLFATDTANNLDAVWDNVSITKDVTIPSGIGGGLTTWVSDYPSPIAATGFSLDVKPISGPPVWASIEYSRRATVTSPTTLVSYTGPWVALTPDTWTRLSGAVTLGSNPENDGDAILLGVRLASSAAGAAPVGGQVVLLDGFMLSTAFTQAEALSNVQTYFDGDTPPENNGLIRYSWTGTPHQSVSIRRTYTYWDYDPAHVCFTDVQMSFDTRSTVNDLKIVNHGRKADPDNPGNFIANDVNHQATNAASVAEWGPRADSIDMSLANISGANVTTRGQEIVNEYGTPERQVTSVTFSGQQFPQFAASLDIYSRVRITVRDHTALYRVATIKHEMTPTKWIVSLGVIKERA